jgi:hypothetical protein|tara:strand:+ start:287 stop:544 length:258 start_codon:yes stop_codon:yes gene_type:complete
MYNEDTFNFLTGLGFKQRKAIGEHYHINYELEEIVSIRVPNNARIVNINQLIKKIVEQSYERGEEVGKREALTNITNKLKSIVYE